MFKKSDVCFIGMDRIEMKGYKLKRSIFRKIVAVCMILCAFAGFYGCSSGKTIVLTTGLNDNQIFKIESAVCTKPELMVYLMTVKNSYEEIYGEDIWNTKTSGESIKDSIKETVLARISKVKVLTLMAKEKKITLSEDEIGRTKAAAKKFYDTLSDDEKTALDVDEEVILHMYQDYAIAEKVYLSLISDINPEISDDDARTVTVSHIMIKTTHTDFSGVKTSYSEVAMADAKRRAELIYSQILEGEDFSKLVLEFNEDVKSEYSFRKGEMDPVYEETAMNLGNGEISPVIKTKEGFYIIKMLNAFDKDETDANKQAMIKQMKEDAFQSAYESFLNTLTGNLNGKVWEEIDFTEGDVVKTDCFFEIYEEFFPQIEMNP